MNPGMTLTLRIWATKIHWELCCELSILAGAEEFFYLDEGGTGRLEEDGWRKEAIHTQKEAEGQWICLREHLQETIDFPIRYMGLSCKCSPNPIYWEGCCRSCGMVKLCTASRSHGDDAPGLGRGLKPLDQWCSYCHRRWWVGDGGQSIHLDYWDLIPTQKICWNPERSGDGHPSSAKTTSSNPTTKIMSTTGTGCSSYKT